MEFKPKAEDKILQISEDILSKLKVADFTLLSPKAKAEMAKMLASWYEGNIGRDSKSIKDIRQVSDKLLEVIEDEDVQGEYIVFANNYIAFLILECENENAKQLLEKWVKKVKQYRNLEWRVLLYASYSELIVRSCPLEAAYAKVIKISEYISKFVENDTKPELLSSTILKSFCSILINHAKLILALENEESSIERVKEIIQKAKHYNSLNNPDPAIESIIDRIESIYNPKDKNSFDVIQSTGNKRSDESNAISSSNGPLTSSQSNNRNLSAKHRTSPKQINGQAYSIKHQSKSPEFRIKKDTSKHLTSKGIFRSQTFKTKQAQAAQKKEQTLKQQTPAPEAYSDSEMESENKEFKLLKESTMLAMQELKELKENKQMIDQYQKLNSLKGEKEAKMRFLNKLIKYEKAIASKKDDLQVYEEKIEALERLYHRSENNKKKQTPVSKPPVNFSIIEEKKQRNLIHPSMNFREPENYPISSPKVSEFGKQPALSDTTVARKSPSEKLHATQGIPTMANSDARGSTAEHHPIFLKTKDSQAEISQKNSGNSKQEIVSNSEILPTLNEVQLVFFTSFNHFKQSTTRKPRQVFSGTTNDGDKIIYYTLTVESTAKDPVFLLSMSNPKRIEVFKKLMTETQFLGLCMALMQEQDNHLMLKPTLAFPLIFKFCVANRMKLDLEKGFHITRKPTSLLPKSRFNMFDREFDAYFQHIRSGTFYLLTFVSSQKRSQRIHVMVCMDPSMGKTVINPKPLEKASPEYSNIFGTLKRIEDSKSAKELEIASSKTLLMTLDLAIDISQAFSDTANGFIKRLVEYWKIDKEAKLEGLLNNEILKILAISSPDELIYSQIANDEGSQKATIQASANFDLSTHHKVTLRYDEIQANLQLDFSQLGFKDQSVILRSIGLCLCRAPGSPSITLEKIGVKFISLLKLEDSELLIQLKRVDGRFGPVGVLISFGGSEVSSPNDLSLLIVSEYTNLSLLSSEVQPSKIADSVKSLDSLELFLNLLGITPQNYLEKVNKVFSIEEFLSIPDLIEIKQNFSNDLERSNF